MNLRVCTSCAEERKESDFINSETCYRCVFKEKVRKTPKIDPKFKKCGICDCRVPKTRWVYCSVECANIAEMKRQKNYWMRKL